MTAKSTRVRPIKNVKRCNKIGHCQSTSKKGQGKHYILLAFILFFSARLANTVNKSSTYSSKY